MAGLDKDARTYLEAQFDEMLKDPKSYEESFSIILEGQGIEPNLESMLSLVAGYILGGLVNFYHLKYRRMLNDDEKSDLLQIMKRRAWELRQAFIGIRIER